MSSIIEDMKASLEEAKDAVVERYKERQSYKARVNEHLYWVRLHKRSFNKATRDWHAARKNVLRIKSKISRLPRESRNWTKANMGKVLEKMQVV